MTTNVQQLIQGLAPLANNGNPNTVYNTPASPFANPAQGLPPNWTLNNLPSYQTPNWQQLSANAPNVLDNFRGFGLSGSGPLPPGTPGTTPPPVQPPVVPPVVPPHVGTGGVDNPYHTPGSNNLGNGGGLLNYNDSRIRNGSGNGWGLLNFDPGMTAGMFTNDPQQGVSKGSLLSGLQGLGDLNVNLGEFGQSLANTSLGRAIGVSQNGSFNLAQALDWVLPGNLYMAQTGQWNLANAIPAIFGAINPLLGFGVAKIMDVFGAKYENIDDSKLNWLQRLLKNRYIKNKENHNAGLGRGGGGARDRGTGRNGGSGGGIFIGGSYGYGGGTGGTVSIGGTGTGDIGGSPGGGVDTTTWFDVNTK